MSKMMITYLESFFGVSPFLQTQDSPVDARVEVLYRDTMEKLDEVFDEACIKYVAHKMLVWYTKFPPKNYSSTTGATGLPLLSKPALLLSTSPTSPPWPKMGPAQNVAWPSSIMRVQPPHNY
jgi:hypothetical protein